MKKSLKYVKPKKYIYYISQFVYENIFKWQIKTKMRTQNGNQMEFAEFCLHKKTEEIWKRKRKTYVTREDRTFPGCCY